MEISTRRIIWNISALNLALTLLYFGAAGTLRWPAGWVCWATDFAFMMNTALWLKKHDPVLLEKRMNMLKKTGEAWDQKIMSIFGALSFAAIVVAALDAARFHWTHVPIGVQVAAYIGVILGQTLIFRVMRTNTFLTPVVEIQRDRNHTVISTGPYAYVRHPMYSAMLLNFFATPLLLGSLWALVVGAVSSSLFIYRIVREEQTLRRELPGYEEYTQRVRYRIIPGVW